MHLLPLLPFLTISTLSHSLASKNITNPKILNITVLSAQNNASTLECWALQPGFATSSQPGTAGTESLDLGRIGAGNAGNASLSVLPAGFDGGRHFAPVRQHVFLSFLLSIPVIPYRHRFHPRIPVHPNTNLTNRPFDSTCRVDQLPLSIHPYRWVLFLSGLAHITLPTSNASALIRGGKHGIILALDTADVSALGHYTVYPSNEQTVAMQIPLGEGGVPPHRVLYGSACEGGRCRVGFDLSRWRAWGWM